jgi:hypothetical protein
MLFPRGLVVVLWFDVISWLAPNLGGGSSGFIRRPEELSFKLIQFLGGSSQALPSRIDFSDI